MSEQITTTVTCNVCGNSAEAKHESSADWMKITVHNRENPKGDCLSGWTGSIDICTSCIKATKPRWLYLLYLATSYAVTEKQEKEKNNAMAELFEKGSGI